MHRKALTLLKRARFSSRHYSACIVCSSSTNNDVMKINGATANVSTPINGASIGQIPTAMLQSNLEKAFANNSNILQRLTPQDSVAVFIDAQNSSPEHFELAQQHLNNSIPSHSLTTIKRIYGDHGTLFVTWDKSILRHKLHVPYHYPNKHLPNLHNADPLIIMDIMETLYNNPAKAYILVTGDGDFTPVVHKLKEAGKIVIGYGREKSTSDALSSACHYFVDTQELIDAENKRMMEEKERRQEEGKALAKKLAVEKRKKEEELADTEQKRKEKEQAATEQKRLEELPNRYLQSVSPRSFPTFEATTQFISLLAGNLFTNPLRIRALPKDPQIATISNTEVTEKLETTEKTANPSQLLTKEEILEELAKREQDALDGWVQLDRLGNLIDSKKFGYKKLSQLFDDMTEVDIKKTGRKKHNLRVRRRLPAIETSTEKTEANSEATDETEKSSPMLSKNDEEDILEELAKREHEAQGRWVQLSLLGSSIDCKKFGYKKLPELFQDMAQVEVEIKKKKKKKRAWVRRLLPEIEKSTEKAKQSSSMLAAQKVILEQITKIDDKDTEGWVDMSVLGNSIEYKKLGVKKLSTLFHDMAEVETEKRKSSMYVRTRPSDKQAYCHD